MFFKPEIKPLDYLRQVRDGQPILSFLSRGHDYASLARLQEGGSSHATPYQRKFFYCTQESLFRVFFSSLLGALISFAFLYYFSKNSIDAGSAPPNSGPVLNNWLTVGRYKIVDWLLSLAALTQLVKDRGTAKWTYLSDQGKWYNILHLTSAIIISFFMQPLCMC